VHILGVLCELHPTKTASSVPHDSSTDMQGCMVTTLSKLTHIDSLARKEAINEGLRGTTTMPKNCFTMQALHRDDLVQSTEVTLAIGGCATFQAHIARGRRPQKALHIWYATAWPSTPCSIAL
jgi:hypothetical protein